MAQITCSFIQQNAFKSSAEANLSKVETTSFNIYYK